MLKDMSSKASTKSNITFLDPCFRRDDDESRSFWIISKTYRAGAVVDELECFIDKNLAGHFAQAGPGDILIAVEAVPILLCEYVAEGVVCKTEKEVVAAVHLSLEIVADVRQGLAGDGKDLCIGDVDDV